MGNGASFDLGAEIELAMASTPPANQQIQLRIEKFAVVVSRNGPDFERQVAARQATNPGFAFLRGGEGADYYKYCIGGHLGTRSDALLTSAEKVLLGKAVTSDLFSRWRAKSGLKSQSFVVGEGDWTPAVGGAPLRSPLAATADRDRAANVFGGFVERIRALPATVRAAAGASRCLSPPLLPFVYSACAGLRAPQAPL